MPTPIKMSAIRTSWKMANLCYASLVQSLSNKLFVFCSRIDMQPIPKKFYVVNLDICIF